MDSIPCTSGAALLARAANSTPGDDHDRNGQPRRPTGTALTCQRRATAVELVRLKSFPLAYSSGTGRSNVALVVERNLLLDVLGRQLLGLAIGRTR